MNAATRVMSQDQAWGLGKSTDKSIRLSLSRQAILSFSLAMAVMFSAFAVIYMQNFNRQLYVQLQSNAHAKQAMQIESGKLLLEKSVWSGQSRIEDYAQNELAMTQPKRDKFIQIKQ